jgi:predicted transcriptional regulator
MAALQETFRVRVAKTFKKRFERIAARERRTPSDLGRLVLADYIEQKEKQTKAAA